MNTTYGQDIWNYGAGKLRNCGEGFGGRKAVVALKKGFTHFLRFAAVLLLVVVGVSGAWGQPFTVTTDASSPVYYLLQNVGTPSFYAMPYSNSDETKISTTNVPNSDMRFYFMSAGEEAGTQYYFIIHCSGKYLYAKDNANTNDGARLKTSATIPTDDRYKFYIAECNDAAVGEGYYIINKQTGSSAPLCKRSGNVAIKDGTFLKMNKYTPRDAYFLWLFIPISDTTPLTWTAPFNISTTDTKYYYKIRNLPKSTFYLSTNSDSKVIGTTTTTGDEMVWYFEDAGSDDWCHYYYVVNATTGKYMHFAGNGNTTDNQSEAANIVSESDKDDNCKFIVVQNANTRDPNTNTPAVCYNYIPKALSSNMWKSNSIGLSMSTENPADKNTGTATDNAPVRTQPGRGYDFNTANWIFELTDACNDPTITFDETTKKVNISNTTSGASVYYTTTGENPTRASTLYDGNGIELTGNASTTIKAVAVKDGNARSNVVTKTFIYMPDITLESGPFIYDGSPKTPSITRVTVGETPVSVSADDYDISYENNTDAGTATVTIREKTDNATIIYGTTTFTIAKADINPTVSITGWAYGGYDATTNSPSVSENPGNATVTYSYKVQGADDETYSSEVPTNAGNYTVKAIIAESDNYNGATVTADFTISKADFNPTVSITEWAYGGYDATTNSPSVSENPGSAAVTYSYKVQGAGDGTYSSEVPTNAGNYTIQAIIAESDNYNGATVTADFTISKADFNPTVSITGWAYGGYDATTNSPSVSENPGSAAVTYNYKVQGADDETYSTTVPTNAGNYTVQAIIAESDNYSSKTVTTDFTISKIALTVTAKPNTIVYGDSPAADGVTYSGFINDETEETEGVLSGTLTYTYNTAEDGTGTDYTTTSDIGTYYIIPGGLSATNYDITFVAGVLTVDKAASSATAPEAIELTYSGEAQNLVTAGTPVGGTMQYRLEDGTYADAIPTGTNVGTYNVYYKVVGDGNHRDTDEAGPVTVTISAKTLTITAEAKSKIYGDEDPELTYTSDGLVGSDAITGELTRDAGEVVGTYAINQGDLSAGSNYNISYTGAYLTIVAKALTITADSDTKEFDGSALTKDSYTNTALAEGDVIESVTITGSQTDMGSSENVPSDAVIKNAGGDVVTTCYDITYVNGTLTVTGKLITITADSETKVYDGTALTKNSYTCDGTLFANDEITSVTVTGSQTAAGSSNNVPSAAVIMNGETDVTANYTITYVNGTLEVTQKALTITADSETKVYDGSALTKNTFTNTDLATGDIIESVTMTGSQTVVGTSDNEPTAAVIKSASDEDVTSSYAITFAKGTLTVTQKALTITADSDTKEYDGEPLTKDSYTHTELATGDVIESVTMTGSQTEVGSSNNVPSAAVIKNGETDVTACYDITYVNGTLTVDGKSIGDGALATGFTISFEGDDIILKDGETTLTEGADYSIEGTPTTSASGRYSIRTINGINNYGGTVNIRNAIVPFMNDGNEGTEYSATFVAEPAGEGEADNTKGHALPSGITAYIITAINGNTVTASPLSYIPEGVPVLLLSNTDASGFLVQDVSDQTPPSGTNLLKEVTAESEHFDVKTIYLLYKNEFAYNKAGDLAKWRVYLEPPTPATPSPARLAINWGASGGIDTSLLSPVASPLPEAWYSFDGRRLNGKPTKKGLYIRNGQKVVIK